jgi:hypothetical protein
MTNRKIQYWVIPPTEDGEFVAHRSEVLETYAQPYNPKCPVLCMDEQPVQLTGSLHTYRSNHQTHQTGRLRV